MKWLTADSKSVLDFGCGSGTALFLCAMYGTKQHIGIDLSVTAIEKARIRSERMGKGEFVFFVGGTEKLGEIKSENTDAVILSNILDNLYPNDAEILLEQTKRILRRGGKILIKLNQYLNREQIEKYSIKSIGDDLLNDGLLLWNRTDSEWSNKCRGNKGPV